MAQLCRRPHPPGTIAIGDKLPVNGEGERRPNLTQMYGPAVRRKRISSTWRLCGLASMYPASDGAVYSPGHHGYQRACVLISGQASNGPNGSPRFACVGKTGPPSRFILSQTSAGKRDYVMVLS